LFLNAIRDRFVHRPNLAKIVDNVGWLFLDKMLRMGLGILVTVWMARYLGPEQFGLLNFAIAFTGLFGVVASLGLKGIVIRDIIRSPERVRLTLGTAGVLQVVAGLLMFLITLGAIGYLRADDPVARSIVAILGSLILLKAVDIAEFWFESQVQSKYTVWVQNSVFVVFAGIKVMLIVQESTLLAFVWVMVGEALVVTLAMFIMMGKRGHSISSLQVSSERAKSLLQDSWPLILSAMAVVIYMKIDQIMLGQLLGDQAVGVYTAATRISEAWYFIPSVIMASVFPALLDSKKQNEITYHQRLQDAFNLMVVLSVGVSVPMTLLSGPIIDFLYGEAYAQAGTVLAIHMWGSVFVFLGVASNKWFLAENRQMQSFQRTAMGALVNIGLNMVLIPVYGAVGAAIATIFAQFSAAYVFDLFHPSTRLLFFMKTRAFNLTLIFKKTSLP